MNLNEPTNETANQDKNKSWRKGWRWLEMIGISNDDLKNGSDRIEKLKYPPWDKRNDRNQKENQEEVISYGKNSGRSYQWIKSHDPNYFSWMLENNDRFRQKVTDLGLFD